MADEGVLERLQELFSSKYGQKVQYTAGRVMLTFTFLDDARRVFGEWGSQVDYMGGQLGPLKSIAPAFLFVLIVAQIVGSGCLLLNKFANVGAWALLGVVATQVLLYTTLFDIHFFLRNAAVIGGLFVLVTSDDPYKAKRMLSGLMDTSQCAHAPPRAPASHLSQPAALRQPLAHRSFPFRSSLRAAPLVDLLAQPPLTAGAAAGPAG